MRTWGFICLALSVLLAVIAVLTLLTGFGLVASRSGGHPSRLRPVPTVPAVPAAGTRRRARTTSYRLMEPEAAVVLVVAGGLSVGFWLLGRRAFKRAKEATGGAPTTDQARKGRPWGKAVVRVTTALLLLSLGIALFSRERYVEQLEGELKNALAKARDAKSGLDRLKAQKAAEARERLMADIEAALATPTKPHDGLVDLDPAIAPGGWKNPKNWKRLREGMTEAQVVQLLGRPTGKNSYPASGSLTLWYSSAYNVKLTFRTRKVTGWDGP